MKQDIHPENYRLVVFKDMSNDYAFLSKSTANSRETITWEDGNEYPLVKMEVSHKSHPFYTGKAQFVDTAAEPKVRCSQMPAFKRAFFYALKDRLSVRPSRPKWK